MDARNPKDAAQRRAVTERLRRFFADLTGQLGAGTGEIWNKVERRISQQPPPDEPAGEGPDTPGPPPHATAQPQPAQQQQSKTKPEGNQ